MRIAYLHAIQEGPRFALREAKQTSGNDTGVFSERSP